MDFINNLSMFLLLKFYFYSSF